MSEKSCGKSALARLSYVAVRPWVFWFSAAAILILDQASKALTRAAIGRGDMWPFSDWPLGLTNVTNTGAAFGILEGQTAFLVAMSAIAVAGIYAYYRSQRFHHWTAVLGLGMLLGGAASNLLDRIRTGGVTDMLDVYRWPTFNLADSGITVGILILVIGSAMLGESSRSNPSMDRPTGPDLHRTEGS